MHQDWPQEHPRSPPTASSTSPTPGSSVHSRASSWSPAAPTFIAVPHRVKVDVVLVAPEEQEAEPGVEGIDGHNEEQADDVTLLTGDGVGAQVQVDLSGRAGAGGGPAGHHRPSV